MQENDSTSEEACFLNQWLRVLDKKVASALFLQATLTGFPLLLSGMLATIPLYSFSQGIFFMEAKTNPQFGNSLA